MSCFIYDKNVFKTAHKIRSSSKAICLHHNQPLIQSSVEFCKGNHSRSLSPTFFNTKWKLCI